MSDAYAGDRTAALSDARGRAVALGRRFTADDLDGGLRLAAAAYADAYRGDFEFLVRMARRAASGLTDGQAVGVLNCLRAEALTAAPAAPDLSGVPDGTYAVVNQSEAITFLRVHRPGGGRFTGAIVVDQVVGDELHRRGHQRPGGRYAGTAEALVAALARDPLGAAIRFGGERRSCGLCGRPLTAEPSRQAGIGPVCGERLGAIRAAGAGAVGTDGPPGR